MAAFGVGPGDSLGGCAALRSACGEIVTFIARCRDEAVEKDGTFREVFDGGVIGEKEGLRGDGGVIGEKDGLRGKYRGEACLSSQRRGIGITMPAGSVTAEMLAFMSQLEG